MTQAVSLRVPFKLTRSLPGLVTPMPAAAVTPEVGIRVTLPGPNPWAGSAHSVRVAARCPGPQSCFELARQTRAQ
jgi:hypothetical protein